MLSINDTIARANVIDITKLENDGKVILGSTVTMEDLETKKFLNILVEKERRFKNKFYLF